MNNSNTLSIHSDQKYVDALVTNDVPLLDELYQKFSFKIKLMVLKNNGTESDAGDIFQDALVSIFDQAKNKDFKLTCPLDAFLYIICRKKWISELERRKSRHVTFTDSVEDINVGEDNFKVAENLILQQERKKLLEEKLVELDENCQELLKQGWSGSSMDNTAVLLNMSNGYARKKKSKCKERLVMLIKQSSKFESLKW